jgi:hypothetical protein
MMVAAVDCLLAMAEGNHALALDRAAVAVTEGERVATASEGVRWCWPFAADAALALDQFDEVERWLAWCEKRPVGHLHPVVRADRLRVRARLLAVRGAADSGATFEAAVDALRQLGSPYHLAVGLADYAAHCLRSGEPDHAAQLAGEARDIAMRLGARPLLARLDAAVPATSG